MADGVVEADEEAAERSSPGTLVAEAVIRPRVEAPTPDDGTTSPRGQCPMCEAQLYLEDGRVMFANGVRRPFLKPGRNRIYCAACGRLFDLWEVGGRFVTKPSFETRYPWAPPLLGWSRFVALVAACLAAALLIPFFLVRWLVYGAGRADPLGDAPKILALVVVVFALIGLSAYGKPE